MAELTMVERKVGAREMVAAGDEEGRGQCSGGGLWLFLAMMVPGLLCFVVFLLLLLSLFH